MSTANSYGDTAMSPNVSSALRSRSTASCERRSGKPARSWRWPILAVVLGLFAHQDALAQNPLTDLRLTDTDTTSAVTIVLDPLLTDDLAERSFTATTEVTSGTVLRSVPFRVTQVTVDPTRVDDTWSLEYSGPADANGAIDGHQRNLTPGSNTIRVTVTKSGETAQTYTIAVTRAVEIGSALNELTVVTQESDNNSGTITVDALDPVFPSADPTDDDRTFTAKAGGGVTQVTVTATPKDGWTTPLEFLDEPDAVAGGTYQRNLAVGANRIRIRATPDGASGTRDYTITVTRTTTPGAPRSLRATSTGVDGTVGLTWTAPSSNGDRAIDDYQFRSQGVETNDGEWVEADGWADVPNSDDSTTSANVSTLTAGTSLVNGTTYMFQVRARNANGGGRPSDTVEATPAGPLGAPQDLTAEAGSRRVKLTWRHLSDDSLIGYQYRRSVGAGAYGGWTNIAERDLVTETVAGNDSRSYTVTGLNNGTQYRFEVRGRNSAGGGARSNEASATPMAGAPGAPTNLSATAGDEQVTLSWTAPSDNGGEPITGYEYRHRAESSATYPAWTATGGTGTTVTVYNNNNNLTNGTTYYFQVRAVNDLGCSATEMAGCGQPSLELSATPFGTPKTTVSLLAAGDPEPGRGTRHGDRRVTLEWRNTTPGAAAADGLSGFQYRQKAGGGYGRWIDVRNSDASTSEHVVAGLTNGTTYTFQVRAVNSSGGGLASNEVSAVPSTTPGTPTLTTTAGDEQVGLTWTAAPDGGRRISGYQCQMRIGAGDYPAHDEDNPPSCAGKSLGASATSLTLTDDDDVRNDRTYTFQVRAVNGNGEGDWSNEASARPTDTSGERSYTISATVDGKSWAKAGVADASLRATVEVSPRFTAQNTTLTVTATGALDDQTVMFGPTDSRRDASLAFSSVPNTDIRVAVFMGSDTSPADAALAVTRVEVRPNTTPEPPMGLVAARGDGEVTLSWATVMNQGAIANYDYDYRQKRQAGSYGRWTDFAGTELQSTTVTSNTVTGLTDGGTYAFQVRAVALTGDPPTRVANAESDPSDEVSVSLSGTVETGGLSAPRDLDAAPGNGQVALSWTAPATDGGSAITEYQYQQRAGTGAYGQWTTIPGGSLARAHTVTGLANGTRYYYRVRAVNSDGAGPPSAEESATPTSGVDTTLRALSLSVGTLAPAFAPATRIYTAAVGSSAAQVTVTATPNKQGATRTITPADANTTVAGHQVALAVGSNRIRVRVTDGTNTGDYTITVTRAGSVPAAPTRLTATADGESRGRGDAVVDGADRRRGRQPVRVPAEGGNGCLWRLDAHSRQRSVHHVAHRHRAHQRHGLRLQGPRREQRGQRRGVERGHGHAGPHEARLGEIGKGGRRRDHRGEERGVRRRQDVHRGRDGRSQGELALQRGRGR